MTPRALGAALFALGLACASQRRIRIRPVTTRDLTGVVFLPWASSKADGFFDAKGRPCPPFRGEIRDFFAGWQSPDAEPLCDHDTFDDGVGAATLDLRWRGTIPANGAWDVVTGGYSAGAWGRVMSRGSHHGDYFASARMVLEATSPHCRAEWSVLLALVKIDFVTTRGTEFSGWTEIPDTRLAGCVAGDPIEVRLKLVGDSSRGRIEVEAFGFSVAAAYELNRMFGLRPAVALAPPR